MNNAQLELSFSTRNARQLSRGTHRPPVRNPQWWFRRMRQIVDNALDWQPAPPPPPEQISFPLKDFSPWAA